jgi:hypothetical protein
MIFYKLSWELLGWFTFSSKPKLENKIDTCLALFDRILSQLIRKFSLKSLKTRISVYLLI